MKDLTRLKRGDVITVNLPKIENSSLQSGRRPCIIVSNDDCNKHSPVIEVIPMTTKTTKNKLPTHWGLYMDEYNGLKEDSIVLAEQIRSIDKKMIINKLGYVVDYYQDDIDYSLMVSLGIIKANN